MKKADLFKNAEVITSNELASIKGGQRTTIIEGSRHHDNGDSIRRDNGSSQHHDNGDSWHHDNMN